MQRFHLGEDGRPDGRRRSSSARGQRAGQFDFVPGLSVDPAREHAVFVADDRNHRIQRLHPGGAFEAWWARSGAARGSCATRTTAASTSLGGCSWPTTRITASCASTPRSRVRSELRRRGRAAWAAQQYPRHRRRPGRGRRGRRVRDQHLAQPGRGVRGRRRVRAALGRRRPRAGRVHAAAGRGGRAQWRHRDRRHARRPRAGAARERASRHVGADQRRARRPHQRRPARRVPRPDRGGRGRSQRRRLGRGGRRAPRTADPAERPRLGRRHLRRPRRGHGAGELHRAARDRGRPGRHGLGRRYPQRPPAVAGPAHPGVVRVARVLAPDRDRGAHRRTARGHRARRGPAAGRRRSGQGAAAPASPRRHAAGDLRGPRPAGGRGLRRSRRRARVRHRT